MKTKPLVTPAELSAMMESGDTVIIDTRTPEEYAAGHIAGAVNVREIFSDLAESTPEGVSAMQSMFADLLGKAGVGGDGQVVIYEDAMNNGYGQSCRGFFLLKYLGHDRVSILHGGLKVWTDAGMPLTTEASHPEARTFPVAARSELMLTTPEMLATLGDPNAVALDVRDFVEWTGESSSPYGVDFAPRKGRIPGAVLLEWYTLMDRTGDVPMFRPAAEIARMAAELGITPESKVNIYCFKGARASNAFVALTEAGFANLRLCFASWNEWARDPSLPIETGMPDPKRPAIAYQAPVTVGA